VGFFVAHIDERGVTTRDQGDQMAHDFYATDTDFEIVDRVVELAKQKGVKPAQIALAWLLHQVEEIMLTTWLVIG